MRKSCSGDGFAVPAERFKCAVSAEFDGKKLGASAPVDKSAVCLLGVSSRKDCASFNQSRNIFLGLSLLWVFAVGMSSLSASASYAETSNSQTKYSRFGGSAYPELSPFEKAEEEQEKHFNFDVTDAVPEWAKGIVWYQIFPDRFRNGDQTNDVGGEFTSWVTNAVPSLRNYEMKVTPWEQDWFSYTTEEEKIRDILRYHAKDLEFSFNQTFGTDVKLYGKDLDSEIYLTRRYGGDLQGIRDRISYLKDLGVGAVYLNPVFESESLHRYDTTDYRHIDRELGPMTVDKTGKPVVFPEDAPLLDNLNLEDPSKWGYTYADLDFMKLVNEFHSHGIRVVIDGVFNHSASTGPMMADIAKKGLSSRFYDWIDAVYREDGTFSKSIEKAYPCRLVDTFPDPSQFPKAGKIRYRGWLGNTCTMPEHRESMAWEGSLHPEFQEFVANVIKRWLEPKWVSKFDADGNLIERIFYEGVDGIRLDVYREIDSRYWKKFRRLVKTINPDALILAEDWYDGFDILQGDEADSLMNYTTRTIAENWMISNVGPTEGRKYFPSWVKGFVEYRMATHREPVLHGLMSMLTSHDTDRVFSKTIMQNRRLLPPPRVIGQHTLWDDGTINRPHQTNSNYDNGKPGELERKFYKTIIAFQMAYVGAPVVYYGDEVGMWGADDPTDRKPMVWGDRTYQDETKCTTSFVDYFSETGGNSFCIRREQVKYTVEPDWELREFFRRLIHFRNESKALKIGEVNQDIVVRKDSHRYVLGEPEFDWTQLWGFERRHEDEHVYFISNQDLSRPDQGIIIETEFEPGSLVTDIISLHKYTVSPEGLVDVTIPRDGAVMLVSDY